MRTYEEAIHAMQSGVAMMMNYDQKATDPKHLRVGINSAMVSDSALVRLLISKGIITIEEYKKALTEEANAEVDRYEAEINAEIQRRGGTTQVTLG